MSNNTEVIREVSESNSKEQREELLDLFEIKNLEELKKHLKRVVLIIACALRDNSKGFKSLNGESLYQACLPFIEGRREKEHVSFNDKISKQENKHVKLARKLMRVFLLKDSDGLNEFVEELNESLARKYGRQTFNIYEFMNTKSAKEQKRLIESYAVRSRKNNKTSKSKKPTQAELARKAIVQIAEKEATKDGVLTTWADDRDYILVGNIKNIRGNLLKESNLTSHQLSSALVQLEDKKTIKKDGTQRVYDVYIHISSLPDGYRGYVIKTQKPSITKNLNGEEKSVSMDRVTDIINAELERIQQQLKKKQPELEKLRKQEEELLNQKEELQCALKKLK